MAANMGAIAGAAADGSTAVMSFNTVVNILLGSSLKLLWGMINTF